MANILIEDDLSLMMIAENLKRLRNIYKLSAIKVASILNMTKQGYLLYEAGKREIKISSLIKLSNFYKVSIDSIVGNPYAIGADTKLNYRAYEITNEGIKKIMPIVISTQYNDLIVVKIDDITSKFYWRSDSHVENAEMLFEYKDKIFISKIWLKNDGSGYFYINDFPHFFSKKDKEDLVYIGVLSSILNKNFNIKNFF